MQISAVNDYSIDIPEYIDNTIQPVSTDFDIPNNDGDQIAPPSEIGSAAVVSIDAVAQDNIQTQALQQDFLYNIDELRNGNISRDEFGSFLEENGLDNLNIQEDTLINLQNGSSDNANFAAALFSITQQTTSNENQDSLSSYADYMDRVNEQTQSADVNEKLSAYTANLRN